MSAKQNSKKKRRPRRPRPNVVDDRDIRVRGNGNVVNRGDYNMVSLVTRLLGPLAQAFLPLFAQTEEGRGDYKVKKNSLVLTGTPPTIETNVKMDSFRHRHRDFIGVVTSSSGSDPTGKSSFNVVSYSLNPGQSKTFPWLSQIAANFSEYEFLGMIFFYKPTSGNATGANTSLGQVIIATNYNASAAPFANAVQMLNSEYSCDDKPSEAIIHMIECEPHKNPISELYVRTGAAPTGEDLKTYDLGTVQVATQGQQTLSQNLGELWVAYDMVFYKPTLGGIVSGLDIPTDHFQLTGVASATPLGTSQLQTILRGAIGGSINGVTGTVYTFPSSFSEGVFLICYSCQGTAAGLVPITMTVNTSYGVLQVWATNAGVDLKAQATSICTTGTAANYLHCQIIQFVTNPTLPVTVTFGGAGTLPSGTNYGDLFVTAVNSNLVSLMSSGDDPTARLKLEVDDLRDMVTRLLVERSSSKTSNYPVNTGY